MKTMDKYLSEADSDENSKQYTNTKKKIQVLLKVIEKTLSKHEKRFLSVPASRNLALLGQLEQVERQMKVLALLLR
jgi:hypothetical protein